MAKTKTYLVPVDFSRGSEKALDQALALAKEQDARVLALHVLPAEPVYPPMGGVVDFYKLLERNAREKFEHLAKRKKIAAADCELIVAQGLDFADMIVKQAKTQKAAMIIMGSHGRTGLQRLLLGSVAERTLRYSECPVLIVK